ncbi:7-cyano-7-deazaguanine synthase in queuosine biosynthesis [Rhizobium sp. SG_E_25_P2]|uniref:Qat anti-phage system QueC-like protein QatC n=1 Tax=Rhizobium sp. SG_E_25_P2 TaxID=2879942 RepID=UPI0024762F05|nr:Qat anti-phage system QueC-like protein QatC [Rhizobium sp. SG_E_25_P2]MDH6268215.1 7-cyano-7-deazaguanine synthase in queuosine biosynthesis [Rhizobium sp. SG_E_25_P2]
MRRFTFIGRMGPLDSGPVPIAQSDSTPVDIQFVDTFRRLDFGIGSALDSLRVLGLTPKELAIDLVILSALVNAADTRVSRAVNSQNGWTREIDLAVPVSNTSLWDDQAALLERLLQFLTGDLWRVFFRSRPTGFDVIAQPPTNLALATFNNVSLFSGGLDSLVGAIDQLTAGAKPLLVSHYWDSETSKAQSALLYLLEKHYPRQEIKSVRVRLGFDKHHVNTCEIEDTQRGRSFLFFALAVLAASALGSKSKVLVPENGLIGLNVPLDPLRLGSLSTRTTHPFYMARINELLSRLGLSVELINPYRHMTKGEMLAGCKDLTFLQKIVGQSMSCSSPAKARYKRLSPRHCGTCVPCLIRRASIEFGLGTSDPTLYTVPSLTARKLDTRAAEGEHVRSFQLMMAKVATNPVAAKLLVHVPGSLSDAPQEIPQFVGVFERGMAEVAQLLRSVTAGPT